MILHSVTGSWRHERTRWQAWVGMLDRRRKFGGTGAHSPKKHSRPTAAKLLYASCVAARATTALSAERSGQRQTFRSVGLCLGCAGSLLKRLACTRASARCSKVARKVGLSGSIGPQLWKSPFKNPEGRN